MGPIGRRNNVMEDAHAIQRSVAVLRWTTTRVRRFFGTNAGKRHHDETRSHVLRYVCQPIAPDVGVAIQIGKRGASEQVTSQLTRAAVLAAICG